MFAEPVDAVKLGLHDYHTIISRPMDLGYFPSRIIGLTPSLCLFLFVYLSKAVSLTRHKDAHNHLSSDVFEVE